jgi:hypothetical protein
MQELRREIRSIRPDDRAELRVQTNAAKCDLIAERLEHWALQLVAQVDLAGEAIVEA